MFPGPEFEPVTPQSCDDSVAASGKTLQIWPQTLLSARPFIASLSNPFDKEQLVLLSLSLCCGSRLIAVQPNNMIMWVIIIPLSITQDLWHLSRVMPSGQLRSLAAIWLTTSLEDISCGWNLVFRWSVIVVKLHRIKHYQQVTSSHSWHLKAKMYAAINYSPYNSAPYTVLQFQFFSMHVWTDCPYACCFLQLTADKKSEWNTWLFSVNITCYVSK